MSSTLTLLIPAISLFIYIALSSIEFGASFFSVFPTLLSEENTVKDYMNPLWEVTTIFLAFALTSLFTFFPGATTTWATGLFSLLFMFLISMVVRVMCILVTQYGNMRSLFVGVLYFVACFASALFGSLILAYFLTGSWHLSGHVFIWTLLLTFFAILFAGSSFFRAYAKNPKLTQLVRFSGTFFFLSGTFFILAMFNAYPYLALAPHVAVVMPLILIGAIVVAVMAEMRNSYSMSFGAYIVSLGALFFGFFAAHLPYVIYPAVTIASSATDANMSGLLLTCLCVGLVFVIPALFLLYKLFIVERANQGK